MALTSSADRVVALLTARGTDGAERFARDDVEDFLAVLLITHPQPEPLDDDAAVLLGRFAARAAVPPGATAEVARTAITRYLEEKPLSEAIVAAVHALAREARADAADDVGAALARFAGGSVPTGVLGGGERPAGTVPAGPLARFLVPKKP